MGAKAYKRSLNESRKALQRHFKRGNVSHVTIVQDQSGKVVLVSTNYERAQAALDRQGLTNEPWKMQDYEVEP